mmetsp:Transcript_22678/g.21800  ORF Transcript_22678/g.21800 Transcript_22678/m.21800 type:complete len:490 (-) Transcript_22678:90-1559(-)
MYASFVVIVLIADIYHRAVVVPRLKTISEMKEHSRQLEEGRKAQEAAGIALEEVASQTTDNDNNLGPGSYGENNFRDEPPVKNRALNAILTALSNYGPVNGQGNNNTSNSNLFSGPSGGWGISGDQLEEERLVTLHGVNGILNKRNLNSPVAKNETKVHHDTNEDNMPSSPYTAMVDESNDGFYLDRLCTSTGHPISTAHDLSSAFKDGTDEVCLHFINFWNDIWYNDENRFLDKFLLAVEMPFSILRKLTVSVPCDGYYCRGLIALSFALSPLWMGFYIYKQMEINLFLFGGFPYIEIATAISFLIAVLILRFAPAEDGAMPMMLSAPIALYGFVIAATWVDTIADQLVDVLNFLGIISHIPNSVMGLTILAWGNSMGDLSANVTMAKKGLANMAMTACFAGPIFNILVGLGAGFTALSTKTGEPEKDVDLSTSMSVGFLFLLCNCLLILSVGLFWSTGRITKDYGYCLFALYSVYLLSSLFFEFGNQ